MLNYEPQTHVITSEAPQIFVLLSDLSKILDVITLHSLKEKAFLKKDKKGSNFFRVVRAHHLHPSSPSPSYATVCKPQKS